MVVTLTEAPSMTMAHSSTNLAQKIDAGMPARPRRPDGADRDAEQDRQHQRFEIGLAHGGGFDSLETVGGKRDRETEQDARREPLEILSQRPPPSLAE